MIFLFLRKIFGGKTILLGLTETGRADNHRDAFGR